MENRIRQVRKKQGVSQEKLANSLGITRQAISQYEKGDRQPRLETWQKLADFLGVTVPYLQGIDNFYYDSKTGNIISNEVISYKSFKDKYVIKTIGKKLDAIHELVNQLTLIHAVNHYLSNKENGAKPIYKPVTSKELGNINYLKEHFNFLFNELSVENKDTIIKDVLSGVTAKKITNFKENETSNLFDEISNLNTIHDALEKEVKQTLFKYPSKAFFDGAKDFILNKQFDDETNNLTNDLFITLMAVLAKLDKRDSKK